MFNVFELHLFYKPGVFHGDELSYYGLLALTPCILVLKGVTEGAEAARPSS